MLWRPNTRWSTTDRRTIDGRKRMVPVKDAGYFDFGRSRNLAKPVVKMLRHKSVVLQIRIRSADSFDFLELPGR